MRATPLLAFALLAGCLAPPDATPAPQGPAGALAAFGEPLQLTAGLGGFEPSIRAGPDGILYAAAAKTTRPNAGPRLADWAWASTDGGATWSPLPMGPGDAGALLPGLEGDLAVDGRGRAYYADTYAGDVVLHRWSVRNGAPAWDFSRPALPTLGPLDDRPYLAAHGDGVVHLLLNNGAAPPAPQNTVADPTGPPALARIWAYTSLDEGMTWSPGWGFPGEVFCAPAAAPGDDRVVVVACERGARDAAVLTLYRSADAGGTFRKVWEGAYANGPGYLTPWPAIDAAGWAYAAWLDDRVDWSSLQDVAWAGDAPGKVRFVRSADGAAWDALDVTPFPGRFGMLHLSAGPAGVAAITFHATTDLTPGEATEWFGYALVTPDARAPQPEWHLALLDPRPTAVGAIPPRDFFQNAVGPDGRVHVALQHNRPRTPEEGLQGSGIPADVLYVGQVAGPNLRGWDSAALQ